jgi:hypothetical protein
MRRGTIAPSAGSRLKAEPHLSGSGSEAEEVEEAGPGGAEDIEKGTPSSEVVVAKPPTIPLGSTTTAAIWLIAWFVNNVGVTLLNKWAFAKVSFPYPFALSAVHMTCNAAGAFLYFLLLPEERSKRKSLSPEGFKTILAFRFVIEIRRVLSVFVAPS